MPVFDPPMFWYSISDDDLCATCSLLPYRPGSESQCRLDFPCTWEDGRAHACDDYIPCEKGANLDLDFINQQENQPKKHEITITVEGARQ